MSACVWCLRRWPVGACWNALNGVNALYLDPAQKGWRHQPGVPSVDPCGGRRCRTGWTIPPHPDLWLGDWTGEITGEVRRG